MATSLYQQTLDRAKKLPDAEVWKLVAELITTQTHRTPSRSVTEFFGVLGPVTEDVDSRIRELRGEWEK